MRTRQPRGRALIAGEGPSGQTRAQRMTRPRLVSILSGHFRVDFVVQMGLGRVAIGSRRALPGADSTPGEIENTQRGAAPLGLFLRTLPLRVWTFQHQLRCNASLRALYRAHDVIVASASRERCVPVRAS